MIEIILSVGVSLIVIPWCMFVTKAIYRHDKVFATMKVEMKHDRVRLARVVRVLERKLC